MALMMSQFQANITFRV